MLAKKYRLKRTEFSLIFQTGRRLHGQNLTIIFKPDTLFKCAVVVSKKVAKKAPRRNSIKRRLYDLIGKVVKANAGQGAAIFIVKPGADRLSKRQFKEQMEREIAQALNKK